MTSPRAASDVAGLLELPGTEEQREAQMCPTAIRQTEATRDPAGHDHPRVLALGNGREGGVQPRRGLPVQVAHEPLLDHDLDRVRVVRVGWLRHEDRQAL